jgi:hypothetical protein
MSVRGEQFSLDTTRANLHRHDDGAADSGFGFRLLVAVHDMKAVEAVTRNARRMLGHAGSWALAPAAAAKRTPLRIVLTRSAPGVYSLPGLP